MRILVTGASGQLGTDLVTDLERRKAAQVRGGEFDVVAASHADLDVSRRDDVLGALFGIEPDVVIHSGAYTKVDDCESNPDRAYAVNALGTAHLAEGCERVGAHLVYISTDYVFDGTKEGPYLEWDEPHPLSVYGRSKLAGEESVRPGSTIVRTSWVCGAHGPNMVKTVLGLLARGETTLRFVEDQRGCPSFTADLAPTIADLALGRRPGTFHVTNQGPTSWFEFVRTIVDLAGGNPAIVEPITTAELVPPRPAPRPANSVLENAALRLSGFDLLRPWQEAAAELVEALQAAR